jgi:hypothetical protein
MIRNGTVGSVDSNTGNIPIMNFTSLNDLLSKQYPNYRVNSSIYDTASSAFSMPAYGTFNNLRNSLLSQFNNNLLYAYGPPANSLFDSDNNKNQNINMNRL